MHGYWDSDHPEFPSDVPTAQLRKVNLQKLTSGDVEESKKLFESCRSGFFFLDLQGSQNGETLLGDVDIIFKLAKSVFDLDEESKQKHFLKTGTFFG
jgi:isopenicillin N synthase-like dioxygenase